MSGALRSSRESNAGVVSNDLSLATEVVVAVIKFDEGPEMISKVMGAGVLAVTFDDAVEVVDERKSAKAASV